MKLEDELKARFRAFREAYLTDPPPPPRVARPGRMVKYRNNRGSWLAFVETDPSAQAGDIVEAKAKGFDCQRPWVVQVVRVVPRRRLGGGSTWTWDYVDQEEARRVREST